MPCWACSLPYSTLHLHPLILLVFYLLLLAAVLLALRVNQRFSACEKSATVIKEALANRAHTFSVFYTNLHNRSNPRGERTEIEKSQYSKELRCDEISNFFHSSALICKQHAVKTQRIAVFGGYLYVMARAMSIGVSRLPDSKITLIYFVWSNGSYKRIVYSELLYGSVG